MDIGLQTALVVVDKLTELGVVSASISGTSSASVTTQTEKVLRQETCSYVSMTDLSRGSLCQQVFRVSMMLTVVPLRRHSLSVRTSRERLETAQSDRVLVSMTTGRYTEDL